mgnify:CR=1 FL=1
MCVIAVLVPTMAACDDPGQAPHHRLVVGAADNPMMRVVADIYAGALRRGGADVADAVVIGDDPQLLEKMAAADVDLFGAFSRTLLTELAPQTTPVPAEDVFTELNQSLPQGVSVGDQTLVVPLAHVVESLRPAAGEVQGLGANRHMLNVRGKFIPVLPLYHLLGAADAVSHPEQGVLIVVETESSGQAALLVDTISDQRQFVIKSLDTHYRAVEGVAGATILGDGQVALILDVDGLVTRALTAPVMAEAA